MERWLYSLDITIYCVNKTVHHVITERRIEVTNEEVRGRKFNERHKKSKQTKNGPQNIYA